MKAHYLRDNDGDHYLIPEEAIEEFDSLSKTIQQMGEYSLEWYNAVEEFNDKFSSYIKEGDLYSIKLYLES